MICVQIDVDDDDSSRRQSMWMARITIMQKMRTPTTPNPIAKMACSGILSPKDEIEGGCDTSMPRDPPATTKQMRMVIPAVITDPITIDTPIHRRCNKETTLGM